MGVVWATCQPTRARQELANLASDDLGEVMAAEPEGEIPRLKLGCGGRRTWEVKAMTDLWSYRDTGRAQTTDLVGFQVVATDGAIGNLDAATYDVGGSYIVVDTGFWIFGKKRMLPAGVIDRIDYDRREVYVNLTKDEIRQAPDYEAEREREEAYRQDVGTYYGPYFRS
jgi:hypothetical protein